MYLALRNAAKKWTMPIKDWGAALNQFAVFRACQIFCVIESSGILAPNPLPFFMNIGFYNSL
jgi:hypothetical protein